MALTSPQDPSASALDSRSVTSPQRVRDRQWLDIAGDIKHDPDLLLAAAADAEQVLYLVRELVGLLGADEIERGNEAPLLVLGESTRHTLLAGIETIARLAGDRLVDVHGIACDRARARCRDEGVA